MTALEKHGPPPYDSQDGWEKIAADVGTRTWVQVQKHWDNTMRRKKQKKNARRFWTNEEHNKLVNAIEKHGLPSNQDGWKKITADTGIKRTPKAVETRWYDSKRVKSAAAATENAGTGAEPEGTNERKPAAKTVSHTEQDENVDEEVGEEESIGNGGRNGRHIEVEDVRVQQQGEEVQEEVAAVSDTSNGKFCILSKTKNSETS